MNRRRLTHFISAGFWIGLLYPAMVWWSESVLFVILASIWANVYGPLAAAEAAGDSLTENDKQWISEEITRIIKENIQCLPPPTPSPAPTDRSSKSPSPSAG